jgi:hypothetical protein
MRDRSQTFVEENQLQAVGVTARDPQNLQAVPLHRDLEGIFLVACEVFHRGF